MDQRETKLFNNGFLRWGKKLVVLWLVLKGIFYVDKISNKYIMVKSLLKLEFSFMLGERDKLFIFALRNPVWIFPF